MSFHIKSYKNILLNHQQEISNWPVDTIKRFAIKMLWDSTSVRTTSMPDRIAESNANALRLCCHHRIMGWNPFWLDVFAKLHYNHKKFLQFFLLQHIMSKPRENNWCMELRRLLQKIFQPSVHTAWTLPSFRDYKLKLRETINNKFNNLLL